MVVLALAVAGADPPDLILSDVMMPGLDGFGLLRELRKNAQTKTNSGDPFVRAGGEESSVEGLDAGADDYLAKPFFAREPLARVRTHRTLAQTRRVHDFEGTGLATEQRIILRHENSKTAVIGDSAFL